MTTRYSGNSRQVDSPLEVFNNNNPYWLENEANPSHQSNIITLDPSSGLTAINYPKHGQSRFFTEIMGSKQRLQNGNMLIVESMNGRVFEIDGEGEIVWEYVSSYNEEFASLITHAIRYNYFKWVYAETCGLILTGNEYNSL